MDIYKIAIAPTDEIGVLSTNEARTLELTFLYGDTEQTMTGATFAGHIQNADGSKAAIANGSFSIIESGGNNVGRVNMALTAAQTKKFLQGRNVPFMVAVTISGVTKHYWGTFDEVRQSL